MINDPGRYAAPRIDRRMILARQWDDLVERVRALPGLDGFLRPPPLGALLPAAEGGPVVIINVSHWRCDALLITTDGVDVIPLPRVTSSIIDEKVVTYLRAVNAVEEPERALRATRGTPVEANPFTQALQAWRDARAAREATLDAIMRWLWDDVTEPILARLGITGPADVAPRVWWCPTGVLSLLPLHGAGHHAAPGGATVLDRMVSSYTPTLQVLSDARARPLADGDDRMLIVAVSDTPGEIVLRHVATETAFVRERFPGRHTTLTGSDATVTATRAAMARHRWLHLSCHGYQDLRDPSRAGLALTDGVLRLTDIVDGQHTGEFAFLSACKTATGGVSLPDEAITLAAALHYTGLRASWPPCGRCTTTPRRRLPNPSIHD